MNDTGGKCKMNIGQEKGSDGHEMWSWRLTGNWKNVVSKPAPRDNICFLF
jgi:hypothetical protein